MPTIHHATVKSAATEGVLLETLDDGDAVRATIGKTVITLDGEGFDSPTDAAKEAWAIAVDVETWNLDDAHAGFAIVQNDEGQYDIGTVRVTDGKTEFEVVGDAYDTWADAAEAFAELDGEAEGEAEADEEEEDRGSVVPSGFKALYKEIGIRQQDNGDFLAGICVDHCMVLDGKREVIDCTKVEALASRNGVDHPLESYNGYVQQTRGWEGRYRMTVGNMLRKRIADAGVCYVPANLNNGDEKEYPAPEAFIAKYRTKPKLSKAAKAEAAAAQADIASE